MTKKRSSEMLGDDTHFFLGQTFLRSCKLSLKYAMVLINYRPNNVTFNVMQNLSFWRFLNRNRRPRGHPFMTSTRRGRGIRLMQVDACGRGEGVKPHVDVHTHIIKIRVH